MAITNQQTLRDTISDWLNRADLTSNQLDNFIQTAESRIYDVLRVPVLETSLDFTTDSTSPFLYVPSDFLEAIQLRKYNEDGTFKVFRKTRTNTISNDNNSYARDVDKFIINDGGLINPEASYTLVYYRYLSSVGELYDKDTTFSSTASQCSALGSGASYDVPSGYCTIDTATVEIVTWFIAGEPDLILYGALSAASEFLGDSEASDEYERLFNNKTQSLNFKAANAETAGGVTTANYHASLI